ncbi:MAG: putative quinol monooxygenase [Deltaproteobacteria bacterium]|nr:putative quinol monooxygenase [Deltaproteobacteria bacterium]
MVIVIAKIAVQPGKKQEVFALAQTIIAATRTEEGCISYELLDDPQDAGACSFVERWTDMDALKRHMKTDHFLKWREASQGLLIAGRDQVGIYQAEALKRG